jgi:signal-transduction protein with cAMP-binding, CBS, and nucleotidyltransferase domain
MNKKKEMISELTNTAWSLFEEYDNEFKASRLSREEAQSQAIARISEIRYGNERKDYFWIINQEPRMIMHPYRPELVGKDLNDYKDANGKKLFVDATKVVDGTNEGFIDYLWQWKDDASQVVPKLSYVKSFEPWGWIIGTGIYLDDVAAEIKELKSWLLRISLLIISIITLILLYVIRQSHTIELKRMKLTDELRLSQQKYKTLVDASTEGTIMFHDNRIIFCNAKFSELSGHTAQAIQLLTFEELFTIDWKELTSSFVESKTSLTLETQLKCANGTEKNVVIAISCVYYNHQQSYIVIPKEVSKRVLIEKEAEKLASELQTSLLLMKQPIKHLINEIYSCSPQTSIQEAASQLTRKKKRYLFVKDKGYLLGVVSDSDIRKRVIAENKSLDMPVSQIMTAPIVTISENALLYETQLQFNREGVSSLVTLSDENEFTGYITYYDITNMQQNTVGFLINEITIAETLDELAEIHTKVPVLVNALVQSGDNTANITRIITSITDAFTKRIIELGIEKIGEAPCQFAFVVMGSEGRMEQSLKTDQDNAIIFENVEEKNLPEVRSYFLELGEFIADSLDKLGYHYCNGGMMASNPKWNQPWSVWKEFFDRWMDKGDLESVVEASIFFDLRGIYGNYNLVQSLKSHVLETVQERKYFLSSMAQSVSNYKSPIGVFGNIVGNDTSSKSKNIDVKKILMPIIKFSRLYILLNGYDETNTLARIRRLYEEEKISKIMYDELTLSYNYLMQLRFRFQASDILKGQEPNNNIDIEELTQIEIGTLKKVFSEVNAIPAKVNVDFKST